jgi:hypothetical protein
MCFQLFSRDWKEEIELFPSQALAAEPLSLVLCVIHSKAAKPPLGHLLNLVQCAAER